MQALFKKKNEFSFFLEMEQKIAELEAEVKRLKCQLGTQSAPKREKIAQMSSEVKDSNPYSRLMGK